MTRKTVEDMVADAYEDETLRAAVLQDIAEKGTAKKIQAGQLVLPHPTDARRWLRRKVEAERPPQEDE